MCELNRMWIDDTLGHNAESLLIAASIKLLRKSDPTCVAVQSFADGRLGCGTIYKSIEFCLLWISLYNLLSYKRTGEVIHEQILTNSTSPYRIFACQYCFLIGTWNCLKLKRIGIYILYVRSLNLFVILNLILFMIKEKKRLCGNVTSKDKDECNKIVGEGCRLVLERLSNAIRMLFESLSILCVYNNSRISFYTLILAFRFLHRSHFVLPIIHTTDLGTPDPNKDFMRINGGFYTFDTLKEWIEAELRSKYDATGTSKPSVTTTLTDALNVYLDSKGIGKVSLLDSGVNVDALVITFNGKLMK